MKEVATLKITESGEDHKVEINFPLYFYETRLGYTVECPLFKSFGFSSKSFDRAIEHHRTDLSIFFQVNIKNNSLEKTLKGLGWEGNNDNFECLFPDRKIPFKWRAESLTISKPRQRTKTQEKI